MIDLTQAGIQPQVQRRGVPLNLISPEVAISMIWTTDVQSALLLITEVTERR